MAQLKIGRSTDGTYTVKSGRQIEHVPGDLPKTEIFERIKWAAITMNARVTDITIIETLNRL